ncbi:MAG TPA: alpha/beta hydrolase [Longimicrobiales bacterium]
MKLSSLQQSHGYLEAVGGVRLHYRAWEVAQPRAALVVLHGLTEHSGRYLELASSMATYGIASYALDLRGHGSSEGRRGYVARFEVFLQDVDRFRREVQGLLDPSVPLFLLGHALGGLIALRYLEEYESPFRGAVVLSPWLASALPLPRWKRNLAAFLSRLLPALPLTAGIRAQDLTHDEDVAAAYAADPLVHDTVTPRLFTEASAAMGLVLQRAERLSSPLLILLPGSDRISDSTRGQAMARSFRGPDVTLRVFPGLYHELLGELERTAIRAEIRAWMDARLKGPESD